jgi:hypothetical protein
MGELGWKRETVKSGAPSWERRRLAGNIKHNRKPYAWFRIYLDTAADMAAGKAALPGLSIPELPALTMDPNL